MKTSLISLFVLLFLPLFSAAHHELCVIEETLAAAGNLSCVVHANCNEDIELSYGGDTCQINNEGTLALCSAIALVIEMESLNYHNDCEVRVLEETE